MRQKQGKFIPSHCQRQIPLREKCQERKREREIANADLQCKPIIKSKMSKYCKIIAYKVISAIKLQYKNPIIVNFELLMRFLYVKFHSSD